MWCRCDVCSIKCLDARLDILTSYIGGSWVGSSQGINSVYYMTIQHTSVQQKTWVTQGFKKWTTRMPHPHRCWILKSLNLLFRWVMWPQISKNMFSSTTWCGAWNIIYLWRNIQCVHCCSTHTLSKSNMWKWSSVDLLKSWGRLF